MLELQYLPEGSADCPLIRISGVDSIVYSRLHDAFIQLSNGSLQRIEIDGISGIVAIEGCHVSAMAAKWDRGIVPISDAAEFEWRLTPNTWDNVAGLLEPFCQESSDHGFQWIESAGDVAVLVTRDGTW